jgi:hypothetical protein
MNDQHFRTYEQNWLRLICPGYEQHRDEVWTPDTLWYRSRVETLGGTLVSQGFGKFFNLGMGPEWCRTTAEDIATAITKGDAWASLKLDGSLLIRSVYGGQVMFRTRESLGYEQQPNASEVGDIFVVKSPKLLDPELYAQHSLLFEWTTPSNQIVLKYDEPRLTLVGAVNHATMRYERFQWLEEVRAHLDVPLTPHWRLDRAGFEDLMHSLETRTDVEGWVVRLHDEQRLVKIKCAPYLLKHRLRFHLTDDSLVDMWLTSGRPTREQFMQSFRTTFDEEILMWALPKILELFDKIDDFNTSTAIALHIAHKAKDDGVSRKDFAINMLERHGKGAIFAIHMKLFSGEIIDDSMVKKFLIP